MELHSHKSVGNKTRLALLACALIILLIVDASCIFARNANPTSRRSLAKFHVRSNISTNSHSIGVICNATIYPQACIRDLSVYPASLHASPQELVAIALRVALAIVHEAHTFAKNCSWERNLYLLERQAIEDCIDLMDRAKDQLNAAISNLSALDTSDVGSKRNALVNLNVWLSASLSYQTACADGFDQVSYGKFERPMLERQEHVSQVIVNALYLVRRLSKHGSSLSAWENSSKVESKILGRRRLLGSDDAKDDSSRAILAESDGFPEWISAGDRKLLQAPLPSVLADMVVAQDGTGDYLNITDALNNIPTDRQSFRFVIYIKEGVYQEIVNVPKTSVNVTFLGAGMGNTVIDGNNSVGSGLYNTFRTATIGISGNGFIARDITFRNSAGPIGFQAVAMRAAADYLVFYRCSFEGYQDTLYALSSRQFYRSCKIHGTVDFIFGNSIAIFQSCELLARRPMQGQQNTYTAQGRRVDIDITGFSFQNCTLKADEDLKNATFAVSTYLGRPWKEYSRSVFLQSYMDDLIDSEGWLPWNSSDPYVDTVYYGEYENRGPGSNTSNRVTWKGVHCNMTTLDANQFTADTFILGSTWLPLMEVEYTSGLFLQPS